MKLNASGPCMVERSSGGDGACVTRPHAELFKPGVLMMLTAT